MIGRLTGQLAEKTPPQVLIDVNGVGYEVDVPMSSFYNLPALGERVTLLTHFVVREDAQLLYGFLTSAERAAFRLLIRISGIGPKMALALLSGLSVAELSQAVAQQQAGRLVKVPGIGKKTAERLIIELRDRIGELGLDPTAVVLPGGRAVAAAINPMDDAISALVALGYKLPEASRMVQSLETDGLGSEAIIRLALQASVRR